MAYVYILKSCKDNQLYIGSTINLAKRLEQHNNSEVKSTKSRLPVELYAWRKCVTINEAAKWEKKYKRSHGQMQRDIAKGLLKIALP